jgi:hypothetical protein
LSLWSASTRAGLLFARRWLFGLIKMGLPQDGASSQDLATCFFALDEELSLLFGVKERQRVGIAHADAQPIGESAEVDSAPLRAVHSRYIELAVDEDIDIVIARKGENLSTFIAKSGFDFGCETEVMRVALVAESLPIYREKLSAC